MFAAWYLLIVSNPNVYNLKKEKKKSYISNLIIVQINSNVLS